MSSNTTVMTSRTSKFVSARGLGILYPREMRRRMKVSENDEFFARKSKAFAPISVPRASKCTAGASSDSINF
jgi:hypothetical protein